MELRCRTANLKCPALETGNLDTPAAITGRWTVWTHIYVWWVICMGMHRACGASQLQDLPFTTPFWHWEFFFTSANTMTVILNFGHDWCALWWSHLGSIKDFFIFHFTLQIHNYLTHKWSFKTIRNLKLKCDPFIPSILTYNVPKIPSPLLRQFSHLCKFYIARWFQNAYTVTLCRAIYWVKYLCMEIHCPLRICSKAVLPREKKFFEISHCQIDWEIYYRPILQR